MDRASSVVRKPDIAGRQAADTITLDRQARHRRRLVMTTDAGRDFLLDLPEATYLADGDALVLDNGEAIQVKAAAEPLLEIHAHDAASLMRIAWHIGNRHTPAEVTADAIYIQPDHVLEEMVIGLGAHVHQVLRPFEPEGGAYGYKGSLEHSHHHHGDHGHAHSHSHDHAHAAPAVHAKSRVWRPG